MSTPNPAKPASSTRNTAPVIVRVSSRPGHELAYSTPAPNTPGNGWSACAHGAARRAGLQRLSLGQAAAVAE